MPLSAFDEKSIYGADYYLAEARNEYLILEDRDGEQKRYIDCMSAYASVNFGHCNPDINPFQDLRSDIAACFYPKEAEQYAKWMLNKLNAPDYELLFQVGGSMAVSTALSIGQRVRKGKVAYLKGSFHGLGLDALAVTSVHKNFALQQTPLLENLQNHCIEVEIGQRDIPWDSISTFIYEPIQGANGYIPLPEEWLRSITLEAQQQGVVVISDEIQCGFYRHGHLSISCHLGIQADIYLFSKSMTNGLYPFSAVIYRGGMKESIKDSLYLAHTFQTSSLGCYAAMAVAEFIDANNPQDLCNSIEDVIRNYFPFNLKSLREIHLTGPTLSFEVEGVNGKDIVQQCLERGILIFTGGPTGQRIRFAPPLTIEKTNLIYAIKQLTEVLQNVSMIHSN
ncbi:aminotransferase class III-fold pyridoxal phosphate-dependent enzyme [Paenibacillus taichungensis]|uniref:aminotransferase class III-fold pyridoxal phosphate-dependent enzyme n=1 Tax=Paenibacillus taichungensis TaxID=484184 RepID=UPI002DB956A4|nr:aminotransferase class III-fold pyridoxal phosphate-dependent enzyme [Paenibacillus taichungensis]MEC0106293.1 aminotransferase class III-fold pyridoxal phosphate-dependent enzyme [Paenibacillus taichungensis]MEC0200195.1 aminotransferase class III-fold pyridoxal phosphate-dependent enzyme [Paenibacillus taichungensis]